jgi:hypothetical protein
MMTLTSDEKLDALQDSLIEVSYGVQAVNTRLDVMEATMEKRQESINNVYAFMQATDVRLTKIETCSGTTSQIWSRLTPFLSVLFGSFVTGIGFVLMRMGGS